MLDTKKYSPEVLKRLNMDEGFRAIVSTDKELADLYNMPEKTEEDTELEYYAVMGGRFAFPGGVFRVFSAGVLSLLSVFNSPLICRNRKITVQSVDEAMLIMCYGKDVFEFGSISEIRKASGGFCDVLGIGHAEAAQAILKAVRISFIGLSYIMGSTPQEKDETGEQVNPFDVEWLTRQISMVHETCGYTPEQARWEVSLCELSYIACQKARKAGRIISRPKRAKQCFERLYVLMDERIKGYK